VSRLKKQKRADRTDTEKEDFNQKRREAEGNKRAAL
jgi:hypothetical protein